MHDAGGDSVDPDVDVHDAGRGQRELVTIAAIAVGGIAGAEARYGISVTIDHSNDAWPWSTLIANILGCLLIGLLIIWVERRSPHPLARPFLGTGVLGGFTTFSTFALDDQHLFNAGRPFVALGYSAASFAACFAATAVAIAVARRAFPARSARSA